MGFPSGIFKIIFSESTEPCLTGNQSIGIFPRLKRISQLRFCAVTVRRFTDSNLLINPQQRRTADINSIHCVQIIPPVRRWVEVISIGHQKMDFSFAERLEQLMRERNLYPSQVAKLTGIRRQRIQEYLTGERQPTAYMIKTIAERLNVSADWLLNIKNRPL